MASANLRPNQELINTFREKSNSFSMSIGIVELMRECCSQHLELQSKKKSVKKSEI